MAASGSPSSSAAGGPPAMTSSTPGSAVSARTAMSKPLRSTMRPTSSSRGRPPRAREPLGVKCVVSTPHGTTVTSLVSTPIRVSSTTSSEQVASTRSTSRARPRSSSSRFAGLVSAWPWCRRLTVPKAWKVWATGTPLGRAARSAASPDIQKCAWTTSGLPCLSQSRPTQSPKASMNGSRSSLGTSARWPGRDVHHRGAGRQRHSFGGVGVVPAGVDVDAVAEPRQTARERSHVDVLTSRVDPAQGRERARVLRDHRDSHPVTSVNRWSQSARNRPSP